MVQLPPHSEILQHAFGAATTPGTADIPTTAPGASATGPAPARLPPNPSAELAALLDMEDSIEPAYVQGTERQRRQDLQNRARVDVVLARLKTGGGVPPFNPHDPTGQHFCFRDQNRVLSIGSHAAFLAGNEPAFVLHMHGPGLMARQEGSWIENPDAAFFEALDAASRIDPQASIV